MRKAMMAKAVGSVVVVCADVDHARLLAESAAIGRAHCLRQPSPHTLVPSLSSASSSSSGSVAAIATAGGAISRSQCSPLSWSKQTWRRSHTSTSSWLSTLSFELTGYHDVGDCHRHNFGFGVRRRSFNLAMAAPRAADYSVGGLAGVGRGRRWFQVPSVDVPKRGQMQVVCSGDVEPEEIAWDKSIANTVHLIGRAGHDVDIKYLDTGKIVASLRLAVKRLGAAGQTQDPDWISLEMWGDLAETAANFVQKGRVIYISGRLMVDTWMDKETGKKQYASKVVVNALKFVSSDFVSRDGGGMGMMGGGGVGLGGSMASGARSGIGGGGGAGSLPSMATTSSSSSSPNFGNQWGRGGERSNQGFSSSPSPSPSSSGPPASSSSSTWSSSGSAMAVGLEEQWKGFFADPEAWWDNRVGKRNPRAPDFKHKDTKESLWLGGRGTPAWVADRLAAWDMAKEGGDGRDARGEAGGNNDDSSPSSSLGEGLSGKSWDRRMEYGGSGGDGFVGRGRGSSLFSDQELDNIAF